MRIASTVVLACVLAAGLFGQDPRLMFLKGNEAMERQAYEDAAAAYEEALAALYDRHVGGVHAVAFRLTSDRQVAEEVVQETFLALWNRAELFDPAIEHYRTAQRLMPRDPDVAWNLEIARAVVKDQVARPEPPEILKTLLWFHHSTSEH